MITDKEIKKIIDESIGLNKKDEKLEEAYVAREKQFNLKTEFLSAANKKNHLDLYDKYVAAFNKVSAQLDGVDRAASNPDDSRYRALKSDETYNMNAVYLHELYFSNISDMNSTITMDSLSYMRLARDFGSFDAWQKDFIACCKASRCGWVMTYYNFYTKSFMNTFIDLHSENVPVFGYPIIVMDVWQHAYYRDYLGDVKTYVVAMMKQLNWKVIEKRFEKVDRISKALRG
jgi:superoxide dismutase, Fe-Mn family